MEHFNQSLINNFILIGFSQKLETCIFMFVLLSVIYILTILGNSFLIFTVIISPQLHTPMYYFLCNLAFLDLCYSSCIVPKFLSDIFSKKRVISLMGCLIQMNMNLFLGQTECILLVVMAFDRYIAICFPLHYTVIMSWRVCRYTTVIMWTGSFLIATVPTIARPFVFCKENTLNYSICEILALMEVACGDLSFYNIIMVVFSIFTLLLSPAFILITYICIIISILKVHSVDGRSKAFSTCASHLIVVLMFFGTTMTLYMGQAKHSNDNVKYIALYYVLLTPVLNPLIYSVRNNEVKEAFRKILATGGHL